MEPWNYISTSVCVCVQWHRCVLYWLRGNDSFGYIYIHKSSSVNDKYDFRCKISRRYHNAQQYSHLHRSRGKDNVASFSCLQLAKIQLQIWPSEFRKTQVYMPFSSLAVITSSTQYRASLLSLNRTRQLYITETKRPPGHPLGASTLRATIKETPSTTRSN